MIRIITVLLKELNSATHMPPELPADVNQDDEVVKPRKEKMNVDVVLCNFRDAFEEDPLQAADMLLDLVHDPVTCLARQSFLRVVRTESADLRAALSDVVKTEIKVEDFLRELWWIATEQLPEAIQQKKADIQLLGELAHNPDALELAHHAALQGSSVLRAMIDVHQSKTWNWLRNQVKAGNLRQYAQTDVGAWKPNQDPSELVTGPDYGNIRTAGAERWMVPQELVTITFVDAD